MRGVDPRGPVGDLAMSDHEIRAVERWAIATGDLGDLGRHEAALARAGVGAAERLQTLVAATGCSRADYDLSTGLFAQLLEVATRSREAFAIRRAPAIEPTSWSSDAAPVVASALGHDGTITFAVSAAPILEHGHIWSSQQEALWPELDRGREERRLWGRRSVPDRLRLTLASARSGLEGVAPVRVGCGLCTVCEQEMFRAWARRLLEGFADHRQRAHLADEIEVDAWGRPECSMQKVLTDAVNELRAGDDTAATASLLLVARWEFGDVEACGYPHRPFEPWERRSGRRA